MTLVKHVGDDREGMMLFADGQIACWFDDETVIAVPVKGSRTPLVRYLDLDDEADPFHEVIADPSTPPTRPMSKAERRTFDRIVRLAAAAK